MKKDEDPRADGLPMIGSRDEFESAVLSSEGLVLVWFCADWSGGCHMMTPALGAIAREFEGQIDLVKVDVERAPELGEWYGIRSTPAFLFFRRGRLVADVLGAVPRAVLVEKIRSLQKETAQLDGPPLRG